MTGNRAILVKSLTDRLSLSMLLESSMMEAKNSGTFNPLVVDASQKPLVQLHQADRDGKPGLERYIKTVAAGEVTWTFMDVFADAVSELVKKDHTELLIGRDLFVIDSAPAAKLDDFFETFWLFVPLKSPSVSFLYNFLSNTIKQNRRSPQVYISIVGCPTIEKAAEEFCTIKMEMEKSLEGQFELVFMGHLQIDAEKADIARNFNLPLCECFPQDSLHGAMCYGLNKMLASTQLSDQDFLRCMQNLAATVEQ